MAGSCRGDVLRALPSHSSSDTTSAHTRQWRHTSSSAMPCSGQAPHVGVARQHLAHFGSDATHCCRHSVCAVAGSSGSGSFGHVPSQTMASRNDVSAFHRRA